MDQVLSEPAVAAAPILIFPLFAHQLYVPAILADRLHPVCIQQAPYFWVVPLPDSRPVLREALSKRIHAQPNEVHRKPNML